MDVFDSNLVLIQSSLTGLMLALSIQLPFRTGVFSFAGVGAYGLGAYGAAIMVVQYGQSWVVALSAAIIMSVVVSILLGMITTRLRGMYLAMSTIAFNLVIGVVALNGGDFTGGPTGLFGVITDFGTPHLAVIVVLCVVGLAFTERGPLGRRIDAVRDDPELAAAMGVDVHRYRLAAFVVGGALGGLAGAMTVLTRTTVGPTDITFHLVVLALTMVILGGTRSWVGAAIGAVVFTWLPQVLTAVGDLQDVVYAALVVLCAIYLPRGIHGLVVGLTRQALRTRDRRRSSGVPSADACGDPALEAAALGGDRTEGRHGVH